MEIKTSELIGATLDWAVANATKAWETAHELYPTMTLDPTFSGVFICHEHCYLKPRNPMRQDPRPYMPSAEWEHGGPLIAEHCTALNQSEYGGWWAHSGDHIGEHGEPLVAACRAIVLAKIGDTVTVPNELEG